MQEPLKRVNWILPFGLDHEYSGPPYEKPVIIYDEVEGTWQIQDEERWNRAIFVGDRYSNNMSDPEDIWYTPDIAVEGNNLSIDFFVWNGAGEDCASADLNMTTQAENLNNVTGSLEGPELPVYTTEAYISNLSAGESGEVRVTAKLLEPGPKKILQLRITLFAPYTFTTKNDTSRTYGSARLPRSSAIFVIKTKDAPELVPGLTMRAG